VAKTLLRAPPKAHGGYSRTCPPALLCELELELIQSHMAQKPMLRGEVGCACVARVSCSPHRLCRRTAESNGVCRMAEWVDGVPWSVILVITHLSYFARKKTKKVLHATKTKAQYENAGWVGSGVGAGGWWRGLFSENAAMGGRCGSGRESWQFAAPGCTTAGARVLRWRTPITANQVPRLPRPETGKSE